MKKTNNETNNALIGLILILFFSILGATYLARDEIRDYFSRAIKPDTVYSSKIDTFWKNTTITKFKLIPKKEYITKTDTFYTKEGKDTIFKTENKSYQDTILCEKDTVELRIFTSGIKSNVDSVRLKLKKSEIIKTNTVEITKYVEKPKKFINNFHIQPQAGVGYGLINNKFDAYVGIGIGYDI